MIKTIFRDLFRYLYVLLDDKKTSDEIVYEDEIEDEPFEDEVGEEEAEQENRFNQLPKICLYFDFEGGMYTEVLWPHPEGNVSPNHVAKCVAGASILLNNGHLLEQIKEAILGFGVANDMKDIAVASLAYIEEYGKINLDMITESNATNNLVVPPRKAFNLEFQQRNRGE